MADFENFARLVQHAMKAQDPEETIPACETAITIHPVIGNWPPGFPHGRNMGALHGAQGNAYANRVRGERAENLERAFAAYQSALTIRIREAFPEQWSATQHNLAAAYAYCICGERAENLERDIVAFEAALTVRTREQAIVSEVGIVRRDLRPLMGQ